MGLFGTDKKTEGQLDAIEEYCRTSTKALEDISISLTLIDNKSITTSQAASEEYLKRKAEDAKLAEERHKEIVGILKELRSGIAETNSLLNALLKQQEPAPAGEPEAATEKKKKKE